MRRNKTLGPADLIAFNNLLFGIFFEKGGRGEFVVEFFDLDGGNFLPLFKDPQFIPHFESVLKSLADHNKVELTIYRKNFGGGR